MVSSSNKRSDPGESRNLEACCQLDHPELKLASDVVDLLVERAKSDRIGVYWSINQPKELRRHSQAESSLASGIPGILLTLLEYYSATRDRDIEVLITKAWSWLESREKPTNLSPGFYFGTGGLWYLADALRTVFPHCGAADATDIIGSLPRSRTSAVGMPRASMLGFGSSGTLIGALAANLQASDVGRKGLDRILDTVLSGIKFSHSGVFWDFSSYAVRPSVSFLNGSAGVEYALAGATNHFAHDLSAILLSSISHSNREFDGLARNWPDTESNDFFRRLDDKALDSLARKSAARRTEESHAVSDVIGWAHGTSGILLSRASVARAYGHSELSEICLADCERAIDRIQLVNEQSLSSLGPDIENGLGGILLAIAAYETHPAATKFPIPKQFKQLARAMFDDCSQKVPRDDLSLFTGASGIAYASLRLNSGSGAMSCLNPLPPCEASTPTSQLRICVVPTLIHLQLPHVAAVTQPCVREPGHIVSLETIGRSFELGRKTFSEPLVLAAAEYELGLHKEISDIISFRHHHLREAYKRKLVAKINAKSPDNLLIFERFSLDEDVRLLTLQFDPCEPIRSATTTHILRHKGSHGIVDKKLTDLQLALLSSFKKPAIVLAAISDTVCRVNAANIAQPKLADLCLKIIRGFILAGYLFPLEQGLLRSSFTRLSLVRERDALFPLKQSVGTTIPSMEKDQPR